MTKAVLKVLIDAQKHAHWEIEPDLRKIQYLYSNDVKIQYEVSDNSIIARAYRATLKDDEQLAMLLLRKLREQFFVLHKDITKMMVIDIASELGIDIGVLLSSIDEEKELTPIDTPIFNYQGKQLDLETIKKLISDEFVSKELDESSMGVLDFVGQLESVTLDEIGQVFSDNHVDSLTESSLIINNEGLITLGKQVYCDPETGICFL